MKILSKFATVFEAVFLVYAPAYPFLVWAGGRGWGTQEIVLATLLMALWLWTMNPLARPRREIPAGDPRPWQFLRWMDISGPSGHENGSHEELYLRRLYVWRTPWFGIMLHWIRREDWDRDALHDHPWTFYRFIVSGGYTEELAYPHEPAVPGEHWPSHWLKPSQLRTHKRWSFSKFPTGAYHRITEVKPRTVSLVFNGPKNNSWGFFVPGTGKVGWRDYVNGAR
jgi:hypothetical protein